MAPHSICAVCRLVFGVQSCQLATLIRARNAYSSRQNSPRLFSTSRFLSGSPATPRPYQPKPSPANPETPKDPNSVPPEGRQFGLPTTAAPGHSIAKELRKRASSVTETYVAYGVCENLVKECARQAEYTIPQAHTKNVEIPKTKDGEDLGVGTGWWFESERTSRSDCKS